MQVAFAFLLASEGGLVRELFGKVDGFGDIRLPTVHEGGDRRRDLGSDAESLPWSKLVQGVLLATVGTADELGEPFGNVGAVLWFVAVTGVVGLVLMFGFGESVQPSNARFPETVF